MTATADTRASAGGGFTPALFVVTVFASAGLVFMVEPMIAKLILPLLGGSAAVIGGFAFALWALRKYKLRELDAVPFEADVPDDETFKGFNLSEIHAAQAVAEASKSTRIPSA